MLIWIYFWWFIFFIFWQFQRPNTQVVRQCSSTQLYVCVHLQVWKTKTSNNRFAIRDQRSFSTFLIIKSDVYLFSGVTPITNSENRLQIFLEQQQHQHHHISVCVLLHVIVILQQPQNVQVNPGSWGLNVVEHVPT